MKVFLTGASGFIGGALARQLVAEGHEVTGLVRRTRGTWLEEGVPAGLRLVRGDVTGLDAFEDGGAALRQVDAIAHLAAVRKDWSLTDEELRRANVDAGPALLARAPEARRVLFVSSVAVHGHGPPGRPLDESAPLAPSKRYGRSKVEAEHAITAAARERGVGLTIVRPGITYGPGDTYGMVANMARLLAARRFLLVGSGRSRVNLLHVRDLAVVLSRALTLEAAEGETFITTGPDEVSVGELAERLAAALSRPLPPVRPPEWTARLGAFVMERGWRAFGLAGEPFLTKAKVDLLTFPDVYDCSKARRVLDFRPEVSLDEGLQETVAWLAAAGELGEWRP